MPIYEYKCDKCGVFEVTQRITENALKKCPTCKSKVERIISATSFVLKGSGWYVTDYARAGAKTDSSSDSTAGGASAASSSSDASGNGESSSKTTSESTKSASDKAPAKSEKSTAKADKSASKSSD
jgi:putative FmdB family regulatory protein